MQVIKSIWDFFQNQILGMKWLNELIGTGLSALGLDVTNRWVGSLQFFIYDVIKIIVLLCFLIFLISYIQSFFPPERSKKILGRFRRVLLEQLDLDGSLVRFYYCYSGTISSISG